MKMEFPIFLSKIDFNHDLTDLNCSSKGKDGPIISSVLQKSREYDLIIKYFDYYFIFVILFTVILAR